MVLYRDDDGEECGFRRVAPLLEGLDLGPLPRPVLEQEGDPEARKEESVLQVPDSIESD